MSQILLRTSRLLLRRTCFDENRLFHDSKKSKNPQNRVRMIPESLHHRIFPGTSAPEYSIEDRISVEIPPLEGKTIAEHFDSIAWEKSRKYHNLLDNFSKIKLPPRPSKWKLQAGWTEYISRRSKNGSGVQFGSRKVDFPPENCMVFDVEICVEDGHMPTLAVAVSENAWYVWCSERLASPKACNNQYLTPDDMIPFESNQPSTSDHPRILIGHNVVFDRARVKEQYYQKRTNLRFWDTMSTHIAVCGMTTDQKAMYASSDFSSFAQKRDLLKELWLKEWRRTVSGNSLLATHALHCGQSELILDKSQVELFLIGSIKDIRKDFQNAVTYCADDVQATFELFQALWPKFLERFSHPVTLTGMLEMGTAFLPINENWVKFIENANKATDKVERDIHNTLWNVAENAKEELKNGSWYNCLPSTSTNGDDFTDCQISCNLLSIRREVIPKLLRLTWNGYPLLKRKDYGWGYLVPREADEDEIFHDTYPVNLKKKNNKADFPFKQIKELVDENKKMGLCNEDLIDTDLLRKWLTHVPCAFYKLPHTSGPAQNVGSPLSKPFIKYMDKDKGPLRSNPPELLERIARNSGQVSYWHSNKKRVESQITVWLGKDESVERGVILPQIIPAGTMTRRAVERTWMTVSNPRQERIGSEIKSMIEAPSGYCFVGADVDSQEQWIAAILGDMYTETGKAGSTEFSRMLLEGDKQKGTDLHSRIANELGIERNAAKVLNYARLYGAGEPHSTNLMREYAPTASEPEIKRKVKELFAKTKGKKVYKMKFSHEATEHALKWARKQPAFKSKYTLDLDGRIVFSSRARIIPSLRKYLDTIRTNLGNEFEEYTVWQDGYESEVFNCLEYIIAQEQPKTPVLGCCLSSALCLKPEVPARSDFFKQFLRSRINWVVQSSAVDFLHLLLTSMWYLCDHYEIDARFVISIHDEIRYLVKWEDRYRCAYALNVAHLLTRAMVSHKLGIHQLPQSVAFFSQVDIDKVLRKEPNLECVTPSNPGGLSLDYGIRPGEAVSLEQLAEKIPLTLRKSDISHEEIEQKV